MSNHILTLPSISYICHHIPTYQSKSLTYPSISQHIQADPSISFHILLYPTISHRIPPFWSTGCNRTRKSRKTIWNCQEMLKISTETLQKPCRSSPKRPTKPTTQQTSQKLPPKLQKFTKSLPKVTPRLPKDTKKIPKCKQKATQKASQNES